MLYSENKSVLEQYTCDRDAEKFEESDSLLSYDRVQGMSDGKSDMGEKMWTLNFIGLYAQYAAVGFVLGSMGVGMNFCVYVYGGASNVCANSSSIMRLPWSFKIFYAIFTDSYRPYGMRRKPYMLIGWAGVLTLLLTLAFVADKLNASTWIAMNMAIQALLMVSDVPADGYSVELSQLQSAEKRGQILATGQIVRFSFGILASVVQTFLMNGPTTNAPDCPISWSECWSFGLTVKQYYFLLFLIVLVLYFPIAVMKEVDGKHIPTRTVREFIVGIWDTLQGLTSFYLIVYVLGGMFALGNPTITFVSYYLIKLTSLQSGIDSITSGLAGVAGVWIFTTFWINENWRYVNYMSSIVCCVMALLWLLVFYDIGGLMNPWFTIFIDIDESLVAGLSQLLFSMAVIELAKPGQEATTYELLVSIANASGMFENIISTQLLSTTQAIGCTHEQCPSDTVNMSTKQAYFNSAGPRRFTEYTLLALSTNVIATLVFTRFLPKNKLECHQWNEQGSGSSFAKYRGYLTLTLAVMTVLYGIIGAILILNPDTACSEALGGSGC